MNKFYDISVLLHSNLPVWPGGTKVNIFKSSEMANGEICNVTELEIGGHTGTHLDAPLHFVIDGKEINEIPLDLLIGQCLVIYLPNIQKIYKKDLLTANIPADCKRLLIKTDNSALWDDLNHEFYRKYVALSEDAAQYIVDIGIELIGIDYLSISAFDDPPEIVHEILLKQEVVILEGVDLREIQPAVYDLICLPIKVEKADGIMCRAILRD
jgi:arylformamidase